MKKVLLMVASILISSSAFAEELPQGAFTSSYGIIAFNGDTMTQTTPSGNVSMEVKVQKVSGNCLTLKRKMDGANAGTICIRTGAPIVSPRPVPRPLGEALLHEVQKGFAAEHGCNKNQTCHPHG
jgi:hypothetical protein